jgi:HSP20 family protein
MYVHYDSIDSQRAALNQAARHFGNNFRNLWRPAVPASARAASQMGLLRDMGDHYLFTANLPGVAQDGVELEVTSTELAVKATRKVSAPEGYAPLRRERQSRDHARTLRFGTPIDPDAVEATMKQGTLTIKLPKSAETKPRAIEVQVG